MIELSEYEVHEMERFYFCLERGDVYSIYADSINLAHLFLKILATLVPPTFGTYRFKNNTLDFSDYRNLLPFKRKIGYIAQGASLLSNRTIRMNLLLMRYYFENSLDIELDEDALKLCKIFNISDKLDKRVSEIDLMDIRAAILVRELIKSPELILLEFPEDYISYNLFEPFVDILKNIISKEVPLVFISYDKKFASDIANKTIILTKNGPKFY
ncbi:MAG: hypothetical protein HQK79_00570 [Desulfobacterales bacterium]|nr:hypothetical protein [Desulfobacterales bacterium]